MKTLLVPIAQHDCLDSVFETAILAARRFGSLIEGVSLRPALAEYVPVDMVGGMTWLRDEEADRAEAEAAGDSFVATMEAAGIVFQDLETDANPSNTGAGGARFRWRTNAPPGDAFLGQYARLFSATIVGRPGSSDSAPRMTTVETALFESGRPIILAPPKPPASMGESILIAWNGSTETARAIAFAMPFLRRARRIVVVSAEGGMVPGPNVEDVARSLGCEGIEASSKPHYTGSRTPGEHFLDEASALGCDLIIKGAYTQSRLRQMIFGGPTSHVLAHAEIPVLMAH